MPYKDNVSEADRQLHAQLVTSSWCGLLAALTPLIDAATDESVTENVLKAMQNYAALCGTLGNSFENRSTAYHQNLFGNFFFLIPNRYSNTTRCVHNSNLSIILTSALCIVSIEYGLSILGHYKYVLNFKSTSYINIFSILRKKFFFYLNVNENE